MIKIVVDSGSTKSDWLVFQNKKHIASFQTLGLNPEVVTRKELFQRFSQAIKYLQEYHQIALYFYGSGCGTPRSKKIMQEVIEEAFSSCQISYLEIKEDTYAAVYATCHDKQPGIVCINGTGSNCSYFDGTAVFQAVESLGYIAMDDFSGVSLGRKLIRSYYFKKMPKSLADQLLQEYDMDADTIKENFYKKETPNAYLASFLPFVIKNKKQPFFAEIIREEISFFVKNYIMQFSEAENLPIHFIGSTAFLLQEEVKEILKENNLQAGKFYQRPQDGLITFFTKQ